MATLVKPRVQSEVQSLVQPEPTPRRFSVDEYYAMAEAGILARDERVELIDGEIITMSPIGNLHGAGVDRATNLIVPLVTGCAIVRVQAHVRLADDCQPEPDLSLLSYRDDFYSEEAPGPSDVLLLIEVADSSPSYDRNRKLPLYARHDIPEVWIENIPDRVIEAHRNPVNGEYTQTRTYRPGETITPQAFPDLELPVSQLMGVPAESD